MMKLWRPSSQQTHTKTLCLAGAARVGKTTLLRVLQGMSPPALYDPTFTSTSTFTLKRPQTDSVASRATRRRSNSVSRFVVHDTAGTDDLAVFRMDAIQESRFCLLIYRPDKPRSWLKCVELYEAMQSLGERCPRVAVLENQPSIDVDDLGAEEDGRGSISSQSNDHDSDGGSESEVTSQSPLEWCETKGIPHASLDIYHAAPSDAAICLFSLLDNSGQPECTLTPSDLSCSSPSASRRGSRYFPWLGRRGSSDSSVPP